MPTEIIQNTPSETPEEQRNAATRQQLTPYVQRGDCILFLGAGVHAPPPENSRYYQPTAQPFLTGGMLSTLLARECQYAERFPNAPLTDLQRVSLYYEHTRKRGPLIDSLARHLTPDSREPTAALKMLAALPFKIIITTNYDPYLERALQRAEKHPVVRVYDPDPGKATVDITHDPTAEKPLVFKMHGDLNHRDSIVITDEDYITFIQRMSEKDALHPVPQTARFRMQKWPTLFVGYSLRDYNLRLLFRTLRWRLDPADFPPSFSLDTDPDPLILTVYQDQRQFLTFLTQDLWTVVPGLYREIYGRDFDDTH